MALKEPLSYYSDETALRFHLFHVGEGLMMLIVFPNSMVMLFDCNVTADTEQELLGLLDRLIPSRINADGVTEKIIDAFVNSHRDEDHYRGLKKVNAKFPVKSIWDSGQSGANTASDDYQYYMRLRRKLNESGNLHVLTPSNLPVADFEGVKIFCLANANDFEQDFLNEQTVFRAQTKKQHTNSVVLIIEYAGKKMLLTGDSDWKSWKEKIVPNFRDMLSCNILVASHHGSRSFFTDEANDNIDEEANPESTYTESIKIIQPNITLIPCGDYDTAHHPNQDALKLYEMHTSEAQVYSTCKKGHLSGFIDSNGYYTVAPDRFSTSRNAAATIGFDIVCKCLRDGYSDVIINNGDNVSVGCKLRFSIKTYGGLIEPSNAIQTFWEVSNGGQYEDHHHQEIYYKEKSEDDNMYSFSRDLMYKGTHLLRCKVYNKKKGYVTRIFHVTGI